MDKPDNDDQPIFFNDTPMSPVAFTTFEGLRVYDWFRKSSDLGGVIFCRTTFDSTGFIFTDGCA